jgi:hypothetical protein
VNRHILIDKCLLAAANRIGKPFFRESIDSPPFDELLEETRILMPEVAGAGYYASSAHTPVGTLDIRMHLMHAADRHAPLLVYNMGGSESPFDGGARRIFPIKQTFAINVVAVEAPLQRSLEQLSSSFARLDNYMAMLAATVRMNECILRSDRFRDASITVVAGTSLGGFVANRHHLAFDTADAYVPIVAGTCHGDIFLSTIDSGAIARANPERIRGRLNFDGPWRTRVHPNVFPVLARYDQLNLLEVQGPSYGDVPYEVWDGGHLYSTFHPGLVRRKLLDVVESVHAMPDRELGRR